MNFDNPCCEEGLPYDLICFQHCKNTKIYCFVIPEKCPLCSNYLDTTEFHIPPFRIYLPLANNPSLNSLVIKPSHGSFMNGFVLGQQSLHIGISNSHGLVLEYDKHGLLYNYKPSNWHHHIAISLAKLGISCELIDDAFYKIKSDPNWNAERYDDTRRNCFDFAIEVLNACREADSTPISKLNLAEEIMMPVLKRNLRVVSLFRKVRSEGGLFYQT